MIDSSKQRKYEADLKMGQLRLFDLRISKTINETKWTETESCGTLSNVPTFA